MASNQHHEATGPCSEADLNLQYIEHEPVGQSLQALLATHYSTFNNEAQDPGNMDTNQAEMSLLSSLINNIPPPTGTFLTIMNPQNPLEFRLSASESANAVVIIHFNSPIHVFIPAAHPPLSHTEFHVVPEHGTIANPGINYSREVPAEGPPSWYVSPGLRIVPVDLQNKDAFSGQHVIESGEATFFASDTAIMDLLEQMNTGDTATLCASHTAINDLLEQTDTDMEDAGAQEEPAHAPLDHDHQPHADPPYMGYEQEDLDYASDDAFPPGIFGPGHEVMVDDSGPEYYHTSPHSLQDVLRFVESLPKIEIDELDDASRECIICRGPYGEPASFDGGKAEKPVQLPCGHIFGKGCVKVLLSPKSEGEESGWGEILCPLCRRVIEGVEANA